mgnify:CR=1 FL=1
MPFQAQRFREALQSRPEGSVSGGHTHIVEVKDYNEIEIIGKTRDDAAGEAYDKVARAIGLGYPGGPLVDELAKQGTEPRFKEGFDTSRWILLDYGDIIVHVFKDEERDFYKIEKIWKDAADITSEFN